MKFRFSTIVISSIFLFIGVETILQSCKPKDEEGEKLAKTYCGSCHLFPEPSSLPQNVWQYSTLPYMAIMLGVDYEINALEKPLSDYKMLRPKAQIISDEDWGKIKKYYITNAPKTLEKPTYAKLGDIGNLFEIKKMDAKIEGGSIPNITAIAIDTINQKIIAGDQANKVLWLIDQTGKGIQAIKNQDALAFIDLQYANKKEYLLTYIGSTTQRNPDINGSVNYVSLTDKSYEIISKDISNLNRPIYTIARNLDETPDDELIVSEFGFKEGGLSIWKKNAVGTYQRQVLNAQTGATKTIVADFDGDKKNDILALFAQGDERIILYKNKGKMNGTSLHFEEKLLLRFPSIYGSSSFDIADMNKDGKIDIVYTAGDNADFTTILKPYHGVYIFTNQGSFQFRQTDFFHQNGSTKVIPRDFDNDGDIDLAAISLFPDNDHRPLESFIYIENTGKGYIQKTLNINHLGRWMVIDAADIDHDGDIDIVLGSHPVAKFPAGFDPAWKEGNGLLILKNRTK